MRKDAFGPEGDHLGAGVRSNELDVVEGELITETSGGNPAMDYDEHYRTYRGFLKGAKYLVGLVIITLVLMAILLL